MGYQSGYEPWVGESNAPGCFAIILFWFFAPLIAGFVLMALLYP